MDRSECLMEGAVSCLVALMVGAICATLLIAILYPKFGPYSIGFGVLMGFPSGIVIGLWLRTFRAKIMKIAHCSMAFPLGSLPLVLPYPAASL
ncbi:MAG TPA: hypothetical protein VE621_18090 [Bryobacteraceae bacterium]|jgi:hypothetical protein|nr:hypothetical protein [Bryobacteraceae bacterium]